MDISITWYRDSLRNQVVALFEREYLTKPGEFAALFQKFYLDDFQKNKCLMVVALNQDIVVGFQSFFYWPYTLGKQEFFSFQSGNSIVHPEYRGKRIFQKMLNFLNEQEQLKGIDFLMGFPVQASFGNFIKDNWSNILDLVWYIKLVNPFAFFSFTLHQKAFVQGAADEKALPYIPDKLIRLTPDFRFSAWRQLFQNRSDYYTFTFTESGHCITFHLKKSKRKRFLNELIIGNIEFSSEESSALLHKAFSKLSLAARRSFAIHFISIALNEKCKNNVLGIIKNSGYRRTKKHIHFIVKPLRIKDPVLDPERWEIYRSDIDTW